MDDDDNGCLAVAIRQVAIWSYSSQSPSAPLTCMRKQRPQRLHVILIN